MKTLNIGCDERKIEGAVNLDINPDCDPDKVWNLNKFPYPFKDNYFDKIIANHVLEHLDEPEKTLKELLRISKDKTVIYIKVPHFSIYASHIFEHKKTYSCRAFEIFCKKNQNFKIKKIGLRWMRNNDVHNFALRLVNSYLSFLANLNCHFCERIWIYWVGGFTEIYLEMEVKK